MYKPKSVDILGQKYKVTEKPKKEYKEFLDQHMGVCMDDRSEIFIHPGHNRHGQDYWTTLLHEVGHGVFHRNGMRQSGLVDIGIEEIIVETMSTVNYELIKKLLKEITKSGKIATIRDEVEKFSQG